MIEITINYVFIIQTLILFTITGGIGWISRRHREVRDELRKLDGRLVKMETKVANHEELDDNRFATLLRDLDRLEKVGKNR